jgi:hypothetical protein
MTQERSESDSRLGSPQESGEALMQRLDRLLMWHGMKHANKLKVNEPRLVMPPMDNPPAPPVNPQPLRAVPHDPNDPRRT